MNKEPEEKTMEQKLADLMMRGWVMLSDSCPIETCRCPFMKNSEGQKYCAGCEMWQFDKERPVKQKFGELVSLNGKQNVQLKQNTSSEVSKVCNKVYDFNMNLNTTVIQSLQVKLAYLANQLNLEVDPKKTNQILKAMKMCMENMESAKKM